MPAVVSSHNEWDPLEEVIVGTAVGAVESAYEPARAPYYPLRSEGRDFLGGQHDPTELQRAEQQLDALAVRLEREGVVVRRPDGLSQQYATQTPDFRVPLAHAQTCPRDSLLIVGEHIIEVPMAQRSRYFETRAYRGLIKEYFRAGAAWVTAPRPQLPDRLYASEYSTDVEPFDFEEHPAITEFEPCFDAASITRCGRDLFWQPDIVSNKFGLEWLARYLGPGYRIHCLQFIDRYPQHIDTTLVPLRPGLALTNPERPFKDPAAAKWFERNGWRLVEAVPSIRVGPPTARDVSNWISMNTLMLNPDTVIVEAAEEPLMTLLRGLGLEIVACEFDAVFKFGGSFHCCTLDIRRAGTLESYFPEVAG
jgi:glycine amidinotransferase